MHRSCNSCKNQLLCRFVESIDKTTSEGLRSHIFKVKDSSIGSNFLDIKRSIAKVCTHFEENFNEYTKLLNECKCETLVSELYKSITNDEYFKESFLEFSLTNEERESIVEDALDERTETIDEFLRPHIKKWNEKRDPMLQLNDGDFNEQIYRMVFEKFKLF